MAVAAAASLADERNAVGKTLTEQNLHNSARLQTHAQVPPFATPSAQRLKRHKTVNALELVPQHHTLSGG